MLSFITFFMACFVAGFVSFWVGCFAGVFVMKLDYKNQTKRAILLNDDGTHDFTGARDE